MASVYDELQQTLSADGPAAAIDRLIAHLRETGDFAQLFYALLLKARRELGVTPIPTTPAQDLPADVHPRYEEAIRIAGRTVGEHYVEAGNIPAAWNYFRLIGDSQPVKAALERYVPADTEDIYPLVEIAFHHRVHPARGFDLVLDRQGVCSAITMLGSFDAGLPAEVRSYCTRKLVSALHEQLVERLTAEIERHDGKRPEATTIPDLIAGRRWLFGDDSYVIDLSHLGSVVQMSLHLPAGDEGIAKARELCAYGSKLSPKMQSPGEPPFEELYRDAGVYLRVLSGVDMDAGLGHFRAKVKTMDLDRGTLPAEVYVNLLIHAGRMTEAIKVARTYLTDADERQLSCPGPMELCRRNGDYATFADVARVRSDPVHYLAGLLAKPSGS